MHSKAVLFALAATCVAAVPQFPSGHHNQNDYPYITSTLRPFIPVIYRDEVRDGVGQTSLTYKSGDGTQLNEQLALKMMQSHDGKKTVTVPVQQGKYSYTSPDGTPVEVSWVADEQGFRPVGTHILTGDAPASLNAAPERERSRYVPQPEPARYNPEPEPARYVPRPDNGRYNPRPDSGRYNPRQEFNRNVPEQEPARYIPQPSNPPPAPSPAPQPSFTPASRSSFNPSQNFPLSFESTPSPLPAGFFRVH